MDYLTRQVAALDATDRGTGQTPRRGVDGADGTGTARPATAIADSRGVTQTADHPDRDGGEPVDVADVAYGVPATWAFKRS